MPDLDKKDSINKITDWKNQPSLSDLKADFSATRTSHDEQVAKINHWLDNLNPGNAKDDTVTIKDQFGSYTPFGGSGSQSKVKKRSTIKPKLIRKQAEWRYTSLSEPFLNTPDIFNVMPVTAEDYEAAKQNALVLNYQFNNQIDKVNFIDTYVRTDVNEGTVVVRVGWETVTERRLKEYPTYEVRPAQSQSEVEWLSQVSKIHPEVQEPHVVEAIALTNQLGSPMYAQEVGVEVVEEEVVIHNRPTVDVCPYENIYIDPSCRGDLTKAQFIIYSYESNLSDLRKMGLYENLDKVNIDTNRVINDPYHVSDWADDGFQFRDEPRAKVVVYEYWGYWDIDGSGKTTPIVASWIGDTVIRMEESPYPHGRLPFVAVQYLPVKHQVYGEPDGELLMDNQEIYGALTRGMIDIMGRAANAQTGIRKGALDVVNKRRFERGLDYEFNDAGDAQNSIYTHTFPEIPQSAYNMLTLQQQEADSLTGVQAFHQGITGNGLGSTAAAARGALDAKARRELGILRRLAKGMTEIGHMIIAMNQVFLEDEEVIRITNGTFVTVRRDDLAGRFDLDLQISTAEADEQKAQELAFMLQTTAQSMGMDFTKMILSEIADLRKMPHLSQMIRNFNPQPDPLAQQEKMAEIEQMKADIQKTMAETQKILAEAQLTGVKSAETNAKATKMQLDTAEQATGVAHARAMQKDGAQAQANMELKAFEKILDNSLAGNESTTNNSPML